MLLVLKMTDEKINKLPKPKHKHISLKSIDSVNFKPHPYTITPGDYYARINI